MTRLSFKKSALDFACCATQKVKKMSHGVQVMPNSRINLISKLLCGMMLTAAVKFGKYTDDVCARNILAVIGVITSDNQDIIPYTDYAVHCIFITRTGIKHNVVLFKFSGRGDNYDHIAVSLEQWAHTDTSGYRSVTTVALELTFYNPLLCLDGGVGRLHHSSIPLSERVFSKAMISASAASRSTS